jgi:hypothetical protein
MVQRGVCMKQRCLVLAIGVEALHECAALGRKQFLQRILVAVATGNSSEGGLHSGAPADIYRYTRLRTASLYIKHIGLKRYLSSGSVKSNAFVRCLRRRGRRREPQRIGSVICSAVLGLLLLVLDGHISRIKVSCESAKGTS